MCGRGGGSLGNPGGATSTTSNYCESSWPGACLVSCFSVVGKVQKPAAHLESGVAEVKLQLVALGRRKLVAQAIRVVVKRCLAAQFRGQSPLQHPAAEPALGRSVRRRAVAILPGEVKHPVLRAPRDADITVGL